MTAIRKVLLADDDDDLRRLGRLALARVGGWEVVTAATGREAVGVAARELPDVVLLDVSMPEMDGRSALALLRADPATAHIPVIFITARALPEEIASLVALGAAGVITKPFDAMKLSAQVSALLSVARERPARGHGGGPAGLEETLSRAVAAERAAYLANLPRRALALGAALDRARADPSVPLVESARTLAHKLRGSAGSHGLGAVSDAAGRVEEALLAVVGDAAKWQEVDTALAALQACLMALLPHNGPWTGA